VSEEHERADARTRSEEVRVLSIIPPDHVARLRGLPPEGIAGVLVGPEVSRDGFQANRQFIDLMHLVIGAAGPDAPELRAAAQRQGHGWVYVIDLRTPEGPQGQVPTRDIIGGFEVQFGELVVGSYWQNESHEVFTEDGLVCLPTYLHEALLAELARRAESGLRGPADPGPD